MSLLAEMLADAPAWLGRLGESGGTTVVDASGNSRNGTYGSTVTLGASGLLAGDTAADFTPSGYALIPAASWMDSAAFTAEVWFKADAISGYHALMARDAFSAGRLWTFYLLDGKIHVFNGSTSSGVLTGTTTVTVGSRHHAVLTYTGTVLSLYLDGILEAQATVTLPNTNPATTLMVGASYAGTSSPSLGFDGILDEAAYYTTALSATRVNKHYSEGVAGAPTVYLSDAFTRANSTTVPGTPDIGGPYTVRAGTWGINGNQLYTSASSANAIVTFPAAANIDFSAKAAVLGGSGLVFRYTDTSNYWKIYQNSFIWRLGYTKAGVNNDYALGAPYANGDVVRILAVGKQINAYVNGKLMMVVDDPFASTAAIHGFLVNSSTGGRWDDAIAKDGVITDLAGAQGDPTIFKEGATLGVQDAFLYRGRDTKILDMAGVS